MVSTQNLNSLVTVMKLNEHLRELILSHAIIILSFLTERIILIKRLA